MELCRGQWRMGLRAVTLVGSSGSSPDHHHILLKEEDTMQPIDSSREWSHGPEAAFALGDKGILSSFSDAHTSKSGARSGSLVER